jgi:hypothetical protein
VACLTPRARKDSVRPRRLGGFLAVPHFTIGVRNQDLTRRRQRRGLRAKGKRLRLRLQERAVRVQGWSSQDLLPFTSRTRSCYVLRDLSRTSKITLRSRRAGASPMSGVSPTLKRRCSGRSTRLALGSAWLIRFGLSSTDGACEAASTCETSAPHIRHTLYVCASVRVFGEH